MNPLELYKRNFNSCGHLKWKNLEDLENPRIPGGNTCPTSEVAFQSYRAVTYINVDKSEILEIRNTAGPCLLRYS